MMRFKGSFVALLLLMATFVYGQSDPFYLEDNSQVNGGLGLTWIDGTAYTTITLAPEISLGKFGAGLNIELLFNNSEGLKFRQDGWKTGAGILRMIRYLRWGVKHDPVYLRIGSLQAATLGHGFIVGYYSNQVNYDYRKIGLVVDLDFDSWGFESMTSNLGRLEVIGGRAYVRPLFSTGMFILKNLEFGATFATDVDPDGKRDTDDGISEWGVDIGLPIIKTSFLTTTLYADYAKIMDHGDGAAAGVKVDMPSVLGLLSIYAKVEKRFLNEDFVPNYFNTLYELERSPLPKSHYKLDDNPEVPLMLTKAEMLRYMDKTEGIFGELAGMVLGKIRLAGNYQHANGIKNSGILHLEARTKDLIPGFQLLYAYDKVGIETFEDVRTLDYRSVATAEIGYRTMKYLLISLQYRWNFVYDENKKGYVPQERFQPKVSFVMDF